MKISRLGCWDWDVIWRNLTCEVVRELPYAWFMVPTLYEWRFDLETHWCCSNCSNFREDPDPKKMSSPSSRGGLAQSSLRVHQRDEWSRGRINYAETSLESCWKRLSTGYRCWILLRERRVKTSQKGKIWWGLVITKLMMRLWKKTYLT